MAHYDVNRDYYWALCLFWEVNPTPDQIKKAYRAEMKKHHPDITKSDGERAKWLTEANETLSDPVKRAAYDAARKKYFDDQRAALQARADAQNAALAARQAEETRNNIGAALVGGLAAAALFAIFSGGDGGKGSGGRR